VNNLNEVELRECKAFLIQVPLKRAHKTSHGEVSYQKSVVVVLETVEGLTGVGQVDPIPKYSIETPEEICLIINSYIRPILVGKQLFSVSSIMDEIYEIFPDPLHLEAKAAVEMALYDLIGKNRKLPLYKIIGKLYRENSPVVGWIGQVPPETAAKEAIGKLEEGYRALKVKIGNTVDDIERIAKIREEIGYSVELRADANEVLIPITLLKKLERYELKWIEQPAPRRHINHLAEIRKKIDIPILVDESVSDIYSLINIIKEKAADYVKLKVMKQGGITNIMKMINICKAYDMKCTIGHGFNMGISASAELHVIAASSTNVVEDVNEVGGPPDKMSDDIINNELEFSKGSFKVSDRPGLGVEISEEKLKRYLRGDCAIYKL
jgi:L-alanine-DL-glutamate epimerase-like enolase superfamily enzyme